MIIKGSDFTPAPEGMHNAVGVDVVDLGMVDGQFGMKHKLKIVWEIDAPMEDGRRFVVSKRYNVSLHEKSTLFKDLKGWRGRPFTPEELKGFDLDKVIGAPCQLVIVHNERDGSVYADVQTVMKAGQAKITPSGNYTRVKDRPADQQRPGGNGNGRPAPKEDEGIPF
jgi:hypothetical protein